MPFIPQKKEEEAADWIGMSLHKLPITFRPSLKEASGMGGQEKRTGAGRDPDLPSPTSEQQQQTCCSSTALGRAEPTPGPRTLAAPTPGALQGVTSTSSGWKREK